MRENKTFHKELKITYFFCWLSFEWSFRDTNTHSLLFHAIPSVWIGEFYSLHNSFESRFCYQSSVVSRKKAETTVNECKRFQITFCVCVCGKILTQWRRQGKKICINFSWIVLNGPWTKFNKKKFKVHWKLFLSFDQCFFFLFSFISFHANLIRSF